MFLDPAGPDESGPVPCPQAAELACGVESDITRHFTAEPRPTRLPPRPFREIGANAVLRWKEWRAGRE